MICRPISAELLGPGGAARSVPRIQAISASDAPTVLERSCQLLIDRHRIGPVVDGGAVRDQPSGAAVFESIDVSKTDDIVESSASIVGHADLVSCAVGVDEGDITLENDVGRGDEVMCGRVAARTFAAHELCEFARRPAE